MYKPFTLFEFLLIVDFSVIKFATFLWSFVYCFVEFFSSIALPRNAYVFIYPNFLLDLMIV